MNEFTTREEAFLATLALHAERERKLTEQLKELEAEKESQSTDEIHVKVTKKRQKSWFSFGRGKKLGTQFL